MPSPVSPLAAEFGSRIRARRNELGWSQERAAEACGIHWTFLGQVERGQRDVRLSNVVKLARGLEVDPGTLTEGL